MKFIPYGRQQIEQADIDAVVGVLNSERITQGTEIPLFEQAIADYCQAKYAVAVSHGTAALHAACHAAGLGPGDAMWTTPNTFVASANCARFCGASVDFVDIDFHTGNISVECLRKKLREARVEGCLPKVLMVVHFAGRPSEMDKITALSKEYGFSVIEDAAHALGASDGVAPIGSCRQSLMAAFSFHPVKSITCGEGGVVVTNSESCYRSLCRFREHGIVRDPDEYRYASPGSWYYEQQELGYNFRMTDIQAALGRSQLTRLDAGITHRRQLAARYEKKLADLPLQLPGESAGNLSAWHLYTVRLDIQKAEVSREQLYRGLHERGIGCQVHYIPVHTQPYYRDLGFKPGDFPAAEAWYASTLTLPLYAGLTHEEQDRVVEAMDVILSGGV